MVNWREAYDRGAEQKPGQLSWGAGARTKTPVGDDLVVISDNADPMNVVVMERRAGRSRATVKCAMPVFPGGLPAATETRWSQHR